MDIIIPSGGDHMPLLANFKELVEKVHLEVAHVVHTTELGKPSMRVTVVNGMDSRVTLEEQDRGYLEGIAATLWYFER